MRARNPTAEKEKAARQVATEGEIQLVSLKKPKWSRQHNSLTMPFVARQVDASVRNFQMQCSFSG